MSSCCTPSPGMPDTSVLPATVKWALVKGSYFLSNRCPCPGGCKFVMKPKAGWEGWSVGERVGSLHAPPAAENFQISISCVTGIYKADVANDGDCVHQPLYGSLSGSCNSCSGTVGWSQDGCNCCGCEPGETTAMYAVISG